MTIESFYMGFAVDFNILDLAKLLKIDLSEFGDEEEIDDNLHEIMEKIDEELSTIGEKLTAVRYPHDSRQNEDTVAVGLFTQISVGYEDIDTKKINMNKKSLEIYHLLKGKEANFKVIPDDCQCCS